MKVNIEEFDNLIETKGWLVFDSIVPLSLVDAMRRDLDECYKTCRALQVKNGIASDTPYTLHHLVGQSDSFLQYLTLNPLHKYIERYFEGNYILNSFGGAVNKADSTSYANRIHRDIRTYSGNNKLMLNTLIMLDDFTESNGATLLLNGSHKEESKPDETSFNCLSEKALGKKGSILFFNSNVWHAGGINQTNFDRASVTPMYSKPFIKQQFDYCRALGESNVAKYSDDLKQVLGYFSRTPSTLEEWYQPPEKRMYRADQG